MPLLGDADALFDERGELAPEHGDAIGHVPGLLIAATSGRAGHLELRRPQLGVVLPRTELADREIAWSAALAPPLVTLEQTAQSTSALALVGATVVVNGSTAQLANGQATWTLNAAKPATATISIADATGRTAYSGTFTINSGTQTFVWDGRGNDHTLWPDGTYTLTATATDASGQTTAISTQVQAKVNSVDLTHTPPVLSINGQNYTMDQLQKIVAPGTSSTG